MGLKQIAERLAVYKERLELGKADKIEPRHIQKAIKKLSLKEAELSGELEQTDKPDKRERLQHKIAKIHEQIELAHWLEKQI